MRFPGLIILMNPRIICSALWKSAITPSFNGRTVSINLCVLPCICCAFLPIATTLPVCMSFATIDGSSTTTLSFMMINVFAVPKSIATSCVRKLNNPIYSAKLCVSTFLIRKILEMVTKIG